MSFCNISNQSLYPFVLPELPYSNDGFMPHFTAETFDYHHGQHHKTYVTNLNNLLKDEKDLQKKNLEELIILSSDFTNQAIFNNAAQIWNHTFFFNSIKPRGTILEGAILNQILSDFGSVENFTEEFTKNALAQFGSGWVWLVVNSGHIEIMKTANAKTPITSGLQPLLACDVWEHAYYIDYRNRRLDYVKVFIEHMINWEFANKNFQVALGK